MVFGHLLTMVWVRTEEWTLSGEERGMAKAQSIEGYPHLGGQCRKSVRERAENRDGSRGWKSGEAGGR